jgi:hypothetical protein
MKRFAALIAFGAMAAALQPASAAEERILTVFGSDRCPENTICVRAPESERFRIPKALRAPTKTPDSVSWSARSRATLNEGKSGTGSCSAVGSGGWTGCWAEEMRKIRAQAAAEQKAEVVPEP